MKVNMTPNPLDVVTIHASQGDSEARQWEFELHNNGELIDTSEITEQLFFKAYKGGTEQILPENTSTPTTSPFLGDIKYPQGLLTDKEFLYRKSPTEEDGLALIKSIKGNTLVWNQLVQNGNFASGTDNWRVYNNDYTSMSASSNVLTQTINKAVSAFGNAYQLGIQQTLPSIVLNHTYLVKITVTPSFQTSFRFELGGIAKGETAVVNANTKASFVFTAIVSGYNKNILIYPYSGVVGTVNQTIKYENIMCIDLTQMGLSSADQFSSLFPLPYYAYNAGTLLSFNGTGIKATGKNLLKTNISSETINGITFTVNKDENGELTEIIVSGTATQRANFYVLPQENNNVLSTGRYILSCGFNSQNIYLSSFNTSTGLSYRDYGSGVEVPYVAGEDYSIYISVLTGATADNIIFKPMLRLADVEDATFEPYTSSTTSLPISTYFPTGMKNAGSVYDELTPRKAITRIGAVDLGSLDWIHRTEIGQGIFSCEVTSTVLYKRQPSVNFEVAQYINGGTVTGVTAMVEKANMTVCLYHTGNNNSRFIYAKNTAYSDATAFKSAMSGVYLYYELAEYQETPITTASLVTENAEIPLSNEDGILIGKCTEQLSAEPGFHDAKIKLADGDGECYSNKIQLHVERSPQ